MDMTLRPVWRSEILLVALVALLSLGALWLALASSVHQVRHSVLRFLAKAFPLWWVIVIIPTAFDFEISPDEPPPPNEAFRFPQDGIAPIANRIRELGDTGVLGEGHNLRRARVGFAAARFPASTVYSPRTVNIVGTSCRSANPRRKHPTNRPHL